MSKKRIQATQDQVIAKLKSAYDIDDPRVSLIKAGVENDNFLVESRSKKYVFRVYNLSHSIRGERSKQAVLLELEFVSRALKVGVLAPRPIEGDGGQVCEIEVDGIKAFAVLFEFMNGESYESFNTTKAVQLGNVVNKLFGVGSAFQEVPDEVQVNIVDRSLDKYQQLMIASVDLPEDIFTVLSLLHERVLSGVDSVKGLSQGLVHGDLKLENLLFESDELSAVLDFDDFRYSYLLEEAVMALMHNLHSVTGNIVRAGYFQVFVDQLTDPRLSKERKHLKYFTSARLLYDLCKYLMRGKVDLVKKIIADENVRKYIVR